MTANKAQQALVAQRRAQALQLRVAGASLDEIGQALGYGGATDVTRRAAVSKDLTRAFQGAQTVLGAARDELIALELSRYDQLQRAHWIPATRDANTKSAQVVLACIAARRDLLGLDAPQQIEATVTETTQADLELAELVREAQARAAAEEQALRSEQ